MPWNFFWIFVYFPKFVFSEFFILRIIYSRFLDSEEKTLNIHLPLKMWSISHDRNENIIITWFVLISCFMYFNKVDEMNIWNEYFMHLMKKNFFLIFAMKLILNSSLGIHLCDKINVFHWTYIQFSFEMEKW